MNDISSGAFVRLREAVIQHERRAARIDTLERKYDGQFAVVFEAIRELMTPPLLPLRRRIGFSRPNDNVGSKARLSVSDAVARGL